MGLFKNKETGDLYHAYQCTGTPENRMFIQIMLRDDHGFSDKTASHIATTVSSGDHIVVKAFGIPEVLSDRDFKQSYEAHMITPDEEDL